LPGGKEVLFTILGTTKADAQIVVQSLKTGQRRVLIHGAGTARYVPIGYLVYSQDGTLMAAPFNLRRVELTGAPRPVAENIAESVAAAFDFSRFGSLVYIPQAPGTADRTLVWVDRNGTVQPLALPPHRYGWPRVSPDGRSLAVTNNDDGDVWCYGIARGHFSRVTFGGKTGWPIWSPDGKRLAYASKTAGHWDMFSKAADGSGPEELLMGSEHSAVPQAWSPDGQILAFIGEEVSTGLSIGLLPIRGRRQSRQLLQTAFVVMEPTFSPDGRWLAYASNESGRYEVYVQPFPSLNGKWQVSTEGGREPVWARNPRELFYRNGGKMMAVNIVTQPSFQAAKPHLLFEGHYATDPIRIRNYDVMPDGRRFVMVKPSRQEMEAAQINIVFNWFEELNRQFKKDQKQ
jgi:Tol biopolymer transport system component